MELLARSAPTNAKPVPHPMEPVQLALIHSVGTATKTVNALSASMTLVQLTVLLVQQLAKHASMELAALHAMPLNSETLQEAFVHASTDTMSFTMLTNREPAKNAALNALHAQLLQLHALLAIPQGTDSPELMLQDVKLVFANQATTPLLMAHVFSPTVILIHSAPNANKDLDFVFNAWLQETESLKTLRLFVSAWMDFMLTQAITVLLVLPDV